MTKITTIPNDVRARFPAIAARNIADGLRCEPADRPRAEDALRRIYRAANLRSDVPIIWVESPLVGALAAAIADARTRSAVGSAVYSAVDSAVHSAVYSAVHSAVGSAVHSAVHSAVYSAVDSAVRSAVGSAVYSAVDSAVYSAVRSAVDSAVGSAVRFAVYSAVRSAVGSAVGSAKFRWHDWRGGQFWISWPAFVEAIEALGVAHPSFEALHAERDLCQSAGFYWPDRYWIMVCERPRVIRRDAGGLLHCETGPAVDYGETFRLYSWHGVAVPPHWINQRTTLDPREVIKTDNVEQRAAGAAIVGWPRMLDVLEARIVHDSGSEDIGQLIELTLPGLQEPGRFLKARCPRNGIIVEGVPRVSDIDGLPIDTALAAQAWRIGDPLSEYIHPQKRT